MALTAKQQTFCEEYLIDLNATQAAIRAGYSEKTARHTASRLLTKNNIAEYISELQSERSVNTKTDAAWVLTQARECFEQCRDAGELNVARGYLEVAARHVDVRAFDTTVNHSGNLTIKTVSYK